MGREDDFRDRLDDLADAGDVTPLAELTTDELYMLHLKHAHDAAEHPNAAEAFAAYKKRVEGGGPADE